MGSKVFTLIWHHSRYPGSCWHPVGSLPTNSCTNSGASPASPENTITLNIDIFIVFFNPRFLASQGRPHYSPHTICVFTRAHWTWHSQISPWPQAIKILLCPIIFPRHAAVRGNVAEWLNFRFWTREYGFSTSSSMTLCLYGLKPATSPFWTCSLICKLEITVLTIELWQRFM